MRAAPNETSAARRVPDSVPATNRALCAAWLDWLRQQGRAPSTIYLYGSKLDTFCGWSDRPIGDLTVTDLEMFLGRPRSKRARGNTARPSTRVGDMAILRGLYRWGCARGHLAHNPTVDLEKPKVRNAQPRAIDPELWSKVWFSERLDDSERVMLGLGHFLGFRREEMCVLHKDHFSVDSGRIVGFKRKGDTNEETSGVTPYLSCVRLFAEKAPHLIGMPEDFLEPLERLLAASGGFLLPWGERAALRHRTRPKDVCPPAGQTTPDQVSKALRRVLTRLEMPEDAFTPHALRHSFVTRLLEMGVPLEVVSRLANHSSVQITMRYFRMTNDPLARFLGVNLKGA